MLKVVIGLLAFLVVGSSLAYAQESSPPVPSQANFKVLTDARIGIVKAALQLTPEQEKLWPTRRGSHPRQGRGTVQPDGSGGRKARSAG